VLSAFTNSLKIPELRSRIFYTLALLFIARVGAIIPLPGIDPHPLQQFFKEHAASAAGAMVGLYNMFTGGALVKGALFALNIMPYISASIIFQLMTAVVPSLSRLQQEGDVGRQKLTQYTRYATVLICLVQGTLLIFTLENPSQLLRYQYLRAHCHRSARLVLDHVGCFHDCRNHVAHVARRTNHPARDWQWCVIAHYG
jgi:preprotein translocase subunit SecY